MTSINRQIALAAALHVLIGIPGVYAGSLSDPTQPMGSVSNSSAGSVSSGVQIPKLHSTLVSSNRKLAIINGRTFAVGDIFEGAKIVDIRPYEVVLQRVGRTTHLRLVPKLAREQEKVVSQ